MKFSKLLSLIFIFTTFSFFIFSCGSDPVAEGEQAFQSGNYSQALNHFITAKKQKPDDQNINEKIALSFMFRGDDLYKRSKNIQSFVGNFEKAEDYIPDNPTPEFKKKYSEVLFSLAEAYQNTKPQNDIQKEEFLNKAITHLEEAVFQDENNTKADEYLTKIKSENFQKMLDKGKDFYSKAQKQKKIDLYFSAEYYFRKAANFDIHNEEAKKLLSKTREQTLSVLNVRDDLAMAIGDRSHQGNDLILYLALRNFLQVPVKIDIKNFELADTDGNTYPLNEAMMDKYGAKKLKNTELGEMKDHEGIIVFSVPKGVKIEYLGYKTEKGEVVKKYFP